MPALQKLLIGLICASLPLLALGDEPRVFEFSYELMPTALPQGKAVDVYIPLPAEHARQRILKQSLQSSRPGSPGLEARYENGFYKISRPADSDTPISAKLRWADRIHFTTGRDLVLGQSSEKAPLNYFTYPHVEIDGKTWNGKLKTQFSYREVSAATLAYQVWSDTGP